MAASSSGTQVTVTVKLRLLLRASISRAGLHWHSRGVSGRRAAVSDVATGAISAGAIGMASGPDVGPGKDWQLSFSLATRIKYWKESVRRPT